MISTFTGTCGWCPVTIFSHDILLLQNHHEGERQQEEDRSVEEQVRKPVGLSSISRLLPWIAKVLVFLQNLWNALQLKCSSLFRDAFYKIVLSK